MISLQKICNSFLVVSLASLVATAVTFGSVDSLASPLLIQLIGPAQAQILATHRVEAMTKDFQGKAQETIGNITGNPKDQMMGKAKQVESKANNAVEDLKGKMQLNVRTKAMTKNVEGKIQEATGKVTNNRKGQIAGKTKQAESQALNAIEDMKDKVKDNLK